MTKINIKTNNLKELLQLIKLEGKDQSGSNSSMIENCILNCKENKITCSTLAKTSTVLSFITYSKLDVITEGEIPIGNITILLSYLKRFESDDILSIETTDNKLKITRESPKKTALIPLIERENADDSLRAEAVQGSIKQEGDKWKFRNTILESGFKCNVSFINKVLGDGDVENMNRRYPFQISDKVICKVGDDKSGQIETVIPVDKIVEDGSSSYAAGIDNVFSNLDGDVEVYLTNNGPMLVINKTDRYEVKYIIAPLVDEE